MEHTTPDRLFRAFREEGDTDALAALFEAVAPELLRTASALAGDPARGEDLLQATFLTAIERRSTWDGERPLVPWLVGILTRHARAARRRALRDLDRERLVRPGPGEPDEEARRTELERALDGALSDLPAPERQVLILSLRHELTPAEIALALERSPSTVRTQLRRGLARVRERLPRSLAFPAFVVGPEPRGLDAVLGTVLERARSLPPVAPSTSALVPAISKTVMLTLLGALVATGGLVGLASSSSPSASDPVAVPPVAPPPPASARDIDEVRVASRIAVAEPLREVDSGDEPDPEVALELQVLHVVVRDPAGVPVQGARVALEGVRLLEEPDSLYGWRAGEVAPCTTTLEGRAQLVLPAVWQGKHPSAVSFTVDHPEFEPFLSKLVDLVPGQTEVTLERGAVLRVSGWWTDPNGARREVLRVEPELGGRSEVEPGDWNLLPDGRLETRGLASGEHQVALSHTAADGRRFHSAITTVELEPGGDLDLSLELVPAARVLGRLDPAVPLPLDGGEVLTHQSGGDERKLTRTLRAPVASDGTFVLEDLGPGLLEVAVLVPGWTSAAVDGFHPQVLVAGRDAELLVPMVRTGALDVQVRGPDGEAVPAVGIGVSVPVRWRDGRWQYFEAGAWGDTDASGRLRLEGVRPGDVRVFALHPELRIPGPIPRTSEADLEGGPLLPGEERSVELRLVPR